MQWLRKKQSLYYFTIGTIGIHNYKFIKDTEDNLFFLLLTLTYRNLKKYINNIFPC